ncbi:non-oxidative hydroxyarylic acid decarboxylases subunit D [Pelotomaculum propionicicum]|uniref:non-oxidative hydroxyarylic acid decarboxylases subunit D n=1 Tax=Pelotomaculum propionicicum TaxID=258475 RepID=UPI003B804988
MKCVRCLKDNAAKVAEAPDGSKAWEVYVCGGCNFVWRSTEEPEVIDPEKRDPWFQMAGVDVENIPVFSPVPPLRK